jgi:hypothetical protein
VLGKGRSEKLRLSLPPATSAAVAAWLSVRPVTDSPALFVRVDQPGGGRLNGRTIYHVVRGLGEKGGVRARPHGLRHSSITRVLDLSLLGGKPAPAAGFRTPRSRRWLKVVSPPLVHGPRIGSKPYGVLLEKTLSLIVSMLAEAPLQMSLPVGGTWPQPPPYWTLPENEQPLIVIVVLTIQTAPPSNVAELLERVQPVIDTVRPRPSR